MPLYLAQIKIHVYIYMYVVESQSWNFFRPPLSCTLGNCESKLMYSGKNLTGIAVLSLLNKIRKNLHKCKTYSNF